MARSRPLTLDEAIEIHLADLRERPSNPPTREQIAVVGAMLGLSPLRDPVEGQE